MVLALTTELHKVISKAFGRERLLSWGLVQTYGELLKWCRRRELDESNIFISNILQSNCAPRDPMMCKV